MNSDLTNLHVHLLTCAVYGERFLQEYSNQLTVLSGVWDGDSKVVLDEALSHYHMYKAPIGVMIHSSNLKLSKDSTVLASIGDINFYNQLTVNKVGDLLDSFVKKSVILQSLHQITPLVAKGEYDKVFAAFDDIQKKCDFNKADDNLLDLDNFDLLQHLLTSYSASGLAQLREFTYGISAMDVVGQRPFRSQVQGWLGPPGTGKSWHALHFCRVNADLGHNTLLITTEAPEYEMALRYATMVTQLPLREASQPLLVLEPDSKGFLGSVRSQGLPHACKVEDLTPAMLEDAKNRLAVRRGKVKIKAFTPGTATAKDVSAFLAKEADRGTVYDFIALDHLKFMKFPSRFEDSYFVILDYVLTFLADAFRYNAAFTFFHQPSVYTDDLKGGTPLTFEKNSSMAKHVIEPIAAAFSLNATSAEKERNLVRVYNEKSRSPLPEAVSGSMILSSNVYGRGIVGRYSARMKGNLTDPSFFADEATEDDDPYYNEGFE